jgi:hypothetical protein
MPSSGAPVTCAITAGSLPGFSAGDHVKVECKTVGGILTLKEIEKTDSAGEDHSGPGGGGDDDGDHHGGGDDGGGHDD